MQVYRARGDSDPVFETQFAALSKIVDIVRCPIDGSGPLAYLRSMPRIRRAAAAVSPDVIHAHYGLTGTVTLLACGRGRLVVSFMGTDLIGEVTASGRRSARGVVLSAISRALGRWGVAAAIVKSSSMRRLLGERPHVFTIPNGVDRTKFWPMDRGEARSRLDLDSRARYVLFAADPARVEKNYPLAQAAVAALGPGAPELLAVHGEPHERMRLYFNAVDATLLTSWHEGSPNVIKEALACNCPVVSTDVGDVRELVRGVAGCTVAGFDAPALAAGLRAAMDHGKVSAEGGLQQRDLQAMADAIGATYKFVTPTNPAICAVSRAP